MADLARHIRICDPSPEDDMVTKRQAAIKGALGRLRKINGVGELLAVGAAMARGFADGTVPEPVGSIVAEAILKQAPAFVRDEHELELIVVSAVAFIEMLEAPDNGSYVSRTDIIAATLWSALAFQAPMEDGKLELLRQDLLKVASTNCLRRSEMARMRTAPKDVPEVAGTEEAQVSEAFGAVRGTVDALRSNAVLDREELDLLWWALGGRSPTLGRAYEALEPAVRGVVRGIELGILLRRVPARAHRSLALSGVPEVAARALAELADDLKGIAPNLAPTIPGRAMVDAYPEAFPLLTALLHGTANGGPALTGDDWCSRAILEAALASLCQTPAPKL